MQKRNNFQSASRMMFTPQHGNGEINKEKSVTVPDQAMSMREILERYRKGEPLEIGHNPAYDEFDDAPDLTKMSWEERADLLDQVKLTRKVAEEKLEAMRSKERTKETETDPPEEREKPGDEAPAS